VFENRATVGDLARSCPATKLRWRLAKARSWCAVRRGRRGEPAPEPSDELKGIEAALRDPDLTRPTSSARRRAVVLLATERWCPATRASTPHRPAVQARRSRRRLPGRRSERRAAGQELDDERFKALGEDRSERFERWRERQARITPEVAEMNVFAAAAVALS
jgi:hypothetical protein